MNGRVYDPRLGRFLQADPYVQYVDYTQSFNRYSYVFNNPLNAIDPSGFLSFADIVDAVVLVVGAIIELSCSCGAGVELINWWFSGPSQFFHTVENFYMAHNAFSNGNFFAGLYYLAQGVMGVSSNTKGGNRFAQTTSAGTVSGMTDGNFTNGAYTGSFFSALQAAGDVVLEDRGLDERYLWYAQLADAALEEHKDKNEGKNAQKEESWWTRNVVRPWAEKTGIDQYAGTPDYFTEEEKLLIGFLGSGGGAAPGKIPLYSSASSSASLGKFQLGYHPRVWQRAAEDGGFHQFPLLVDKIVLGAKPQVYSNGYRMYRMEGSMYGNTTLYRGNFEIGVHPSGIIDHRMFRPFNPK